MFQTTAILSAALLPAVLALDNGVGRLPAMGWNSWNAYYCDIDAAKIELAANGVVNEGFKAVGYEYINLDDCWSNHDGRDNTTHELLPNYDAFPDGISGLADKIHAMGLKVGIYSSAGTGTCGGYPASLGYEAIDAATWARWGIDYLKYDNCFVPDYYGDTCYSCIPDPTFGYYGSVFDNGTCVAAPNQPATLPDLGTAIKPRGNIPTQRTLCNVDWPVDGVNYTASYTALRFRIMGEALLAQNRTILYSLCEWGTDEVWLWGNQTGNSWRTTNDISPYWWRIAQILNMNSFITEYGDFYGHNDPDMLHVGNGNLTLYETRSHFALWALMKAPLIIGTDISKLSKANIAILQNKHLIAFNQDPVIGKSASPYKWGLSRPKYQFNETNPAEFWSGASSKGTMVAMLNSLNSTRSMTTTFAEVPQLGKGSYNVVDVWTGKSLGCVKNSITRKMQAHDTAVFLVEGPCKKGYGG